MSSTRDKVDSREEKKNEMKIYERLWNPQKVIHTPERIIIICRQNGYTQIPVYLHANVIIFIHVFMS